MRSTDPSTPQHTAISSDWDILFTDEDLEAIDAAIHSASSSSSSSSSRGFLVDKPAEDWSTDGPKTRRRLCDSLFSSKLKSSIPKNLSGECSPTSISSPPFLVPCPRNRFCSSNHSSCEAKLIMRYPAMTFGGHVIYSRTFSEVEKAANELLKLVENKKREVGQAILGFDIEWRPTFRRGVSPGKVAVMQICGDPGHCHVLHIIHSGFPQNLQSLLADHTSVKVGVGIASDATKVFKDHKVSVEPLKDLSFLANQKLGKDAKSWSLRSLTEKLISKQLPKPQNIRTGNWEAVPLSKGQLQYAATDAFTSWYLHEVLSRLPDVVNDRSEVDTAACS